MTTRPLYLSSDESEYSTPNTSPDNHHEKNYPDSINQLIAPLLEQRSHMGTETVSFPPTPITSMISDDDEPSNFTPKNGNREQHTPHIPQQRKTPNTTLINGAACPRHARVTAFRSSRSKRHFPSLCSTLLIDITTI